MKCGTEGEEALVELPELEECMDSQVNVDQKGE